MSLRQICWDYFASFKTETEVVDIFSISVVSNSWKTGHVPRSWREADMVSIHKKGRDQMNTATILSASPAVRANSWREWSTVSWYVPGEEEHHDSRAGRLLAALFHWRQGSLLCPEDWGLLSGQTTYYVGVGRHEKGIQLRSGKVGFIWNSRKWCNRLSVPGNLPVMLRKWRQVFEKSVNQIHATNSDSKPLIS